MGPLKRAEPDTASQLARCDREIARIRIATGIHPAWLITLGTEDWEWEKRMILEEAGES